MPESDAASASDSAVRKEMVKNFRKALDSQLTYRRVDQKDLAVPTSLMPWPFEPGNIALDLDCREVRIVDGGVTNLTGACVGTRARVAATVHFGAVLMAGKPEGSGGVQGDNPGSAAVQHQPWGYEKFGYRAARRGTLSLWNSTNLRCPSLNPPTFTTRSVSMPVPASK